MCGIGGFIRRSGNDSHLIIKKMVFSMRHRGPDDEGTCILAVNGHDVVFGHRRLAIIDLSSSGHQPMVDSLTGCVLIYNGEIYNYRELTRNLKNEGCVFRGSSDTEVLLNSLIHYGTACLQNLDGMFAFAFFDPRNKKLVLGRDPFGIKPLYYYFKAGKLYFASEIRALIYGGVPELKIDKKSLCDFFCFGSYQSPSTFFDNIKMFPAGCFQEFFIEEEGVVAGQMNRYWDFPELEKTFNETNVCEEIKKQFTSAVKSHLISDVPVGIFLSSGMDSTLITSIASKQNSEICLLYTSPSPRDS